MADGLLTMQEAAIRLRCSIRHVSRLIEAGRLDALHDEEGMRRVVEASLAAYERARAQASGRAATAAHRSEDADCPGAAPTAPTPE